MSVVVFIQLVSWDGLYGASFLRNERLIEKGMFSVGERVIIKTKLGIDLGIVTKVADSKGTEATGEEAIILRKARSEDLRRFENRNKDKKKAIKICENLARKRALQIKVVDVFFSFDGGRITFAFVAPGRVDFRLLVKDLSQKFYKSIRMHQLGARQGTGLAGDIGPCGRPLCCLTFLKKLGHITADMMSRQNLAQRGPERLSGVCGKLKCCLSFEDDVYSKILKELPPIGSVVKIKQGQGKVVGYYILKKMVIIKIKDNFFEIPLDEVKA
ncbi:hypothetical protein B6D52_02300 [Candidatus Parcubacteria bacterium 4484_255]|nr:MAG: hypothetical protein B6D52_02300 [Candidatus Parcubacteria bacterium 4484_255]